MPPWSHDKSGSWWRFAASACWSRSFTSASTTEALREKKKKAEGGAFKNKFPPKTNKTRLQSSKTRFLVCFSLFFHGCLTDKNEGFSPRVQSKSWDEQCLDRTMGYWTSKIWPTWDPLIFSRSMHFPHFWPAFYHFPSQRGPRCWEQAPHSHPISIEIDYGSPWKKHMGWSKNGLLRWSENTWKHVVFTWKPWPRCNWDGDVLHLDLFTHVVFPPGWTKT